MGFKDKNNIIEQNLKAFEKKHPFLSKWISLKVRIRLCLLNLKIRK